MRILSITAGAANMYCGSCLRDNALARELLARGHDVLLQPVYTPTRTDEENVSERRVLFGGVSVYLQQHSRFFRQTPWLLDRLWDSPLFLKLVSRHAVRVDPASLGALTVSTLEGEHGFQRKEVDKLAHWLSTEPPFDVINLPTALLIGLAAPIRRVTGRPVCVTLQGEDLFLDGLPAADRARAEALIRQQVDAVDLFVAVSRYYADYTCARFGIPREKMRVAPLGISTTGLEVTTRTRTPSDPFVIGYFARVAPEKGLHVLAEAYRILRQERGLPPSRLEAAGYIAPEHRPYLASVERKLRDWGLGGEFRYHGTLDRAQKVAFLHAVDVLSVPSVYKEPKGLYVLEAMACGVPVVQPQHGAFVEMLQKTSGGLLARPDDPHSLADGISAIRNHPGQAREIGIRGAAAVQEHYSVAAMADRVLEVYAELVHAQGVESRKVLPGTPRSAPHSR